MTHRDDAKEYARKVFESLFLTTTSRLEFLKEVYCMDLTDAYLNGYWKANKEWRQKAKELKSDIEHSGFSMESVLLTLEDWIAE